MIGDIALFFIYLISLSCLLQTLNLSNVMSVMIGDIADSYNFTTARRWTQNIRLSDRYIGKTLVCKSYILILT